MSLVERCRTVAGLSAIRLTLADGSERVIAPGHGRGRWTRLERTLDSLDWSRAELIDVNGAVLDVLTRDTPEADAPVADDPVTRQVATISAETRRHAELLRSMMADALQAQRDTIAMLRDLVRDLAASHGEAVAAIREAVIADARAEIAEREAAAPRGEDETTKLLTQVVAGALCAPAPQAKTGDNGQ